MASETVLEARQIGPEHQREFLVRNLLTPATLRLKRGALVMFTVPRYHRVCRVDQTAGQHRRLSIAGWFMTEHP